MRWDSQPARSSGAPGWSLGGETAAAFRNETRGAGIRDHRHRYRENIGKMDGKMMDKMDGFTMIHQFFLCLLVFVGLVSPNCFDIFTRLTVLKYTSTMEHMG